MLPGRDRKLVTAALMLGNALAALEATAVAPALPTAVAELGGVARLSWVFSAYLLTSTTTVPLYGKLADLYGRRLTYHASVVLFLLGSALCGTSHSIGQLIVFRAIQGLGAGGVQPIALTVVADIFGLEERGRMQGLFSGVWASASLVGPFLGGLITVAFSWRWIFYLNLPLGLASSLLLHRYLREERGRREHQLDVLGTATLTVAVTLLLLGVTEGPELWGWSDGRTLGLFAGAALGLVVFLWQERRAPEPMLPLALFRNRVISVSAAGNAIIGAQLFAITAYVPMFAQGVLGGTAVDAGTTLAPILLGWPIASTLAGRLITRVSYRHMSMAGGGLLAAGTALLVHGGRAGGRGEIMAAMMIAGCGLGFLSTPFLIAVQSAVPRGQRGVATSTVQFFRTIGGAVGVAALGALFNARLLAASGVHPADAESALEPALRAGLAPAVLAHLTAALRGALGSVYLVLAAVGALSLGIALAFPPGLATALALPERKADLEIVG
ncbi:MAG TPA: MDR family MFS transporter [Thermoanaerobaculia bacterium]